jgi:hypothetical protein
LKPATLVHDEPAAPVLTARGGDCRERGSVSYLDLRPALEGIARTLAAVGWIASGARVNPFST